MTKRQPLSVRVAERTATALRRFLPVPVLRVIYRIGYRVGSILWLLTSPSASGSKVVVTRGDQMLFIRQTYGARNNWDLPGGTAGEGETPEETAARELYEEVGLKGDLRPLGSWGGPGRGSKAQLHAFIVEVDPDAELVLDDVEIAEARWFDQNDPPVRIAGGSKEIVKEALSTDA